MIRLRSILLCGPSVDILPANAVIQFWHMGGQTSRCEVVKVLMLVGERALNRCSSTTQRRILFFSLKMVRSDNVILHTLAGCSRDSVVALLDKYSRIDSHCEPSMLSSCVVKRWFWLYFSNLCQAVWPSIRSIHSSIVCSICTAFITVFILFSFVYISVHCTLCIFIFHCCSINKWMDG